MYMYVYIFIMYTISVCLLLLLLRAVREPVAHRQCNFSSVPSQPPWRGRRRSARSGTARSGAVAAPGKR